MKKKKGRERVTMAFALNVRDREQLTLADQIQELKQQRKFVSTVRDGIRLIADLRAGSTDVLFELFPLLKAKLQTTPPPSDVDNLRRQLEILQTAVLGGLQTPPYQQKPLTNNALRPVTPIGGGALNVPTFAAPAYDDDDDTDFVIAKDLTTDSAQNFLNSMLGLQQ